ncbi:GNAT family N-acetyltransferase [Marinobacteraceae bacterium S3BR75-40.1]
MTEPNPVTIEVAQTPEQYRSAGQLFREYVQFLGLDIAYQGFEEELADLPAMYGRPSGALVLARLYGEYAGAVGLRTHEPGVAEMKRMFVRASARGQRVGEALTAALIDQARGLGFHAIVLDSVASLKPALALYRRFGFRDIAPYCYNPFEDAVFMRLELT